MIKNENGGLFIEEVEKKRKGEKGGQGVTQLKRIADKNTPSLLLKPLSVSRIRMLCKLGVQLIKR